MTKFNRISVALATGALCSVGVALTTPAVQAQTVSPVATATVKPGQPIPVFVANVLEVCRKQGAKPTPPDQFSYLAVRGYSAVSFGGHHYLQVQVRNQDDNVLSLWDLSGSPPRQIGHLLIHFEHGEAIQPTPADVQKMGFTALPAAVQKWFKGGDPGIQVKRDASGHYRRSQD